MSTGILTASVLILPAVWGWLTDAVLRRVWPPKSSPPTPAPPTTTQTSPGIGSASVDFQI